MGSLTRIARRVLAAGLLLLAAAPQARADGDLARKITAGEYDAAASSLDDADFASSLKTDSLALRLAAEAAADKAGSPGSEAPFTKILAFLVEAGDAAAAANAEDGDAWLAVAEARSAREISNAAAGTKSTADAWAVVQAAYEKAQAASPECDARKRCVRRLIAAVGLVASQQSLLVARALGVVQKAVKPDRAAAGATSADAEAAATATRRDYGHLLLDSAQAIVTVDRKCARDVAKGATDLLRPSLSGDKTDPEVAALWNDLVTFDRAGRFGIGEKYLTRRITFLGGNYTLDLPVGPRWEEMGGRRSDQDAPDVPDATDTIDPTYLNHLRLDKTRLGWFTGLDYGFAWVYRIPGGKNVVGGDNPSGIAELSVNRFASKYFATVTSTKAPRKGRVNATISGYGYDIVGTRPSGKPLRLHGWVFRGPNQRSFEFMLFDEFAEEDFDPETLSVIESLREREK